MSHSRIVLAYSGGLVSSAALRWLVVHVGAEIVTVTLDVGQGTHMADVRERALALGAARAHVLEAREEFAREFLLPALHAGAMRMQGPLLAAALVAPLLARHLVRIADMERADGVAHGCAPASDSEARLEVSIRALQASLEVLAPARRGHLARAGRPDRVQAGREEAGPRAGEGAPMAPGDRTTATLWGRIIDVETLEDPWGEIPDARYTLTKAPGACPVAPAQVEIAFERGVPVAVNGVVMPLVEIVASLDTIAAAHGVGRVDVIAPTLAGLRQRCAGEAPAAWVLQTAHQELQGLAVPRHLDAVSDTVARTYADLVVNGFWWGPGRVALDAFAAAVQAHVTGAVRVRLLAGGCSVIDRRATCALYDRNAEPFAENALDGDIAGAFIRRWGRPLEVLAHLRAAAEAPAAGTAGPP